jgi:hemerythrin
MALMIWTEKLSVGVKVLDDDHKKLIAIINEMDEGIAAGHKKEVLMSVLDHLVDYTKIHFAREEEFFSQAQYTAEAAHKHEHDLLTQRVMSVQARCKDGSVAMLGLELMSFLKNWLVGHIQGSDQKYRNQLNAKGIR